MAVYNRWTELVDSTSGLDYWIDRFCSKTHIWRLYNEVQWMEIVEIPGLSLFYWSRLLSTPTVMAQSTGKNETEFLLYVCL